MIFFGGSKLLLPSTGAEGAASLASLPSGHGELSRVGAGCWQEGLDESGKVNWSALLECSLGGQVGALAEHSRSLPGRVDGHLLASLAHSDFYS